MAYAKLTTVANVRGWLKSESATNDALLGNLIDSLSAQAGVLLGRDNLGSVENYVENYRIPRGTPTTPPRLLLRHYPVVSIASVLSAGAAIPLITDPAIPSASGVLLEDDRTLAFYTGSLAWSGGPGIPLCQIQYSAGYTATTIPPGLVQAMNQWVGEIVKSQGWIGYTSQSMAGQSTSFEQGRQWGMSKRTKELFEPYRDRIPWGMSA